MPELPPTSLLVETRKSLHRVAEHVLSAALKTATGHIALEPGPGGVRTPPLPDGSVLAVEGTDITVTGPGVARRAQLSTVAHAAHLAGTVPGFPWTKHPPATPLEPDARLAVDAASAQVLADWFALGAEAMGALAREIPEDGPGPAHVYPEHFDLGMVAAEVNYGASPGDEAIELPYLYVGPHEGPPAEDDFWNAPFGAYRTIHDVTTPQDALAFFRAGRDRVRDLRDKTRSSA
ncbi:MAG: hypothetical protein ACRDWY_09160 [Actinomycetes bacterium]